MRQPIQDLRGLLRGANAQLKSGAVEDAIDTVRHGLRTGLSSLSAAEIDKLGRWIRRALGKAGAPVPCLKIRVLGQFTTSWLVNAIVAEALRRGVVVWVDEADYDQVLQQSLVLSDADVVVLVPWSNRLLGGQAEAAIDQEISFWGAVWRNLSSRAPGKAQRVVQVGYDLLSAGAEGVGPAGQTGGHLDRLARVNRGLRDALPEGAYFLDLNYLSGELGRRQFYDPRRYHWTKQPLSEAGVIALAGAIWAGIRALTTGAKKVLVLDLDNTLWGGVVGDEGPLGITLGDGPEGEAFVAFQRYCKALAARGVVLAVASKNNLADAREPFDTNPSMVLSLDDFAAFEACWDPKSVSLARMAQALRLGLDAFVFFDDNPAERALVRELQPQVEVVEVPPDPAEYVRALEAGRWFETTHLTGADRVRSKQYQQEGARRALKANMGSLEGYLGSLEMVGEIRTLDDADMARVVQLLGKTNQFNLTTQRHDAHVLRGMQTKERAILLTLRVSDRFGDHGLVSVVLALPDVDDPETLVIDSWLMSCRVIARGVELFFFGGLARRAAALGYKRIHGRYVPTRKNVIIEQLLPQMGFTPCAGAEESQYTLELEGYTVPRSFVAEPG